MVKHHEFKCGGCCIKERKRMGIMSREWEEEEEEKEERER